MIVSINQPAYLPWLGYFDRIAASHVHIVLDNVQFEKNSFINRNKVRTAKGWTWLTVPVDTSGKFGNLAINTVEIASDARWSRKHWQTVEQSYVTAPYFAAHRSALAAIYKRPWARLIDLTDALTTYLLGAFDIGIPCMPASTIPTTRTKSALVLELCQQVGASTYLSGPLGRNYLDQESFSAAGIDIIYQDYRHPVYPQVQPGFEPYMAAIDLLFMRGPGARRILQTTSHRAPAGNNSEPESAGAPTKLSVSTPAGTSR